MDKKLFMKRALGVLAVSLLLTGCLESETATTTTTDSNSGSSGSSDGTVEISGTISYQRVPFSSTNGAGLDYDNIETLPVRGAAVFAVDIRDIILDQTTSSETGEYSVSVDESSFVRIVVQAKAESEDSDSSEWGFQVVDNTDSYTIYSLRGSISNVSASDEIRNLTAEVEWNDSTSTYDERGSAPFAILDTAYDAVQTLVEVDSDIELETLYLAWSESNSSAVGLISDGDINTSFYSSSILVDADGNNVPAVFILGDENSDTDEFDEHVVAHEIGHFFEDALSRSDSIGGTHSIGNIIDMRLAMSEGFANAFSAIVTGDSVYKDSGGSSQSSNSALDIESNSNTNSGWFSEGSVQSIIYDVFDDNNDGDDTVALGFEAIYDVITSDDYVNQSSFVSIFSFIDELKTLNPSEAAAIDTLLATQNTDVVDSSDSSIIYTNILGIDSVSDKYGTGETHTGGGVYNLPVYKELTDDGVSTAVCSHLFSGKDVNGLGTRQFIKLTTTSAGEKNITVVHNGAGTIAAADSYPSFYLHLNGALVVNAANNTINTELDYYSATSTKIDMELDEYILEVFDYNNLDEDTSTGGLVCFDVTVQ